MKLANCARKNNYSKPLSRHFFPTFIEIGPKNASGVPLHQLDLLCVRHLDQHRLDVVHLGNHSHVPATQSVPWSEPLSFSLPMHFGCLFIVSSSFIHILRHESHTHTHICIIVVCMYPYPYMYTHILYIYTCI